MAKSVITINDDIATLKTALGAAVTAGYFASVADHGDPTDGVSCLDGDGNTVLSLYRNTTHGGYQWFCIFRLADGTTVQDNFGGYHSTQNYAAVLTKIYICSGGIYLAFRKNGNGNGDIGGIIISKTNRGCTGILMLGVPYTNSPGVSYRGNCRSLATDDEAGEAATYFTFSGQILRNQTVMACVPTSADADTISYFEDVKYLLTCQYNYVSNNDTPPVTFTHQSKRYLWTGTFAIRDEEAAT